MLRRLIFVLLLACLALPAMKAKACEGQTTAVAHTMPTHHTPDKPMPRHDCIGCIAPLDISLYRPISAPEFGAVSPVQIDNATASFIEPAAPEPPPPRSAV